MKETEKGPSPYVLQALRTRVFWTILSTNALRKMYRTTSRIITKTASSATIFFIPPALKWGISWVISCATLSFCISNHPLVTSIICVICWPIWFQHTYTVARCGSNVRINKRDPISLNRASNSFKTPDVEYLISDCACLSYTFKTSKHVQDLSWSSN